MLKKLLKYDLKYMLKNMSVFYILTIFFALTTRLFFSLNQTIIIQVISQISVGIMYALIANTLINTLMRSWLRFRDSIYKDEAYLTHTLPVSKNNIYDSKFIQTLIFFVAGFMVIILALFIAYYTKERWQLLKEFINTITTGLDFKPVVFISGFLAVVFLELFNAIQCGFLGIILGHKKYKNKIAFSVLFGFIVYLVSQSLVLAMSYVVGLFNESIMNLFVFDYLVDTNALKLLMILAIILYVVIIFITSIICKKELNKGVNVE